MESILQNHKRRKNKHLNRNASTSNGQNKRHANNTRNVWREQRNNPIHNTSIISNKEKEGQGRPNKKGEYYEPKSRRQNQSPKNKKNKKLQQLPSRNPIHRRKLRRNNNQNQRLIKRTTNRENSRKRPTPRKIKIPNHNKNQTWPIKRLPRLPNKHRNTTTTHITLLLNRRV